jgi:hypothetical protein
LLLVVLSVFFLSGESPNFTIMLAAMYAATGIFALQQWLPSVKGLRIAGFAFFALVVSLTGLSGVRQIAAMSPKLHESSFSLAEYVRAGTSRETRYLLVARHDEAEWFPYLLQREPLISLWGSEWLGSYDEQSQLNRRLDGCQASQEVRCLEELGLQLEPSDILITRKGDRQLTSQLDVISGCVPSFEVGRYLVWSGACLAAP